MRITYLRFNIDILKDLMEICSRNRSYTLIYPQQQQKMFVKLHILQKSLLPL